ncbi:uncharacterized protein PHACADRAFT_159771 [Phanerochaete carnosa HHB-10118-sp]|uniref:Uncharacterized protein n=1 Tax=Phanerochaete carnosa (strain HHB-10118-sp) TaxID=650164 RepID=K5W453_PHACS|nr:uncharacterized protein PHACADRAFT_159771 [Phanerochaete carnosa HHB-10118-sp]EKM58678.1 hypothetical protein PHACADRAFT_159771 [Phanerochaete carnosa HHB-10118-sp]
MSRGIGLLLDTVSPAAFVLYSTICLAVWSYKANGMSLRIRHLITSGDGAITPPDLSAPKQPDNEETHRVHETMDAAWSTK